MQSNRSKGEHKTLKFNFIRIFLFQELLNRHFFKVNTGSECSFYSEEPARNAIVRLPTIIRKY